MPRWAPAVLVGLATLAGAGFRLPALDRFPPGLHFDEAVYGLLARDILHGARPVFFSAWTGREPLYMYLMALVQALVGVNTLAIRLTSALIGLSTVPLTYLLTRELFDRRIALLATSLITVNYWHLTVSRNGYPNILLPPLATLSFYFLWRGYQHGNDERRRTKDQRRGKENFVVRRSSFVAFMLGGLFAGLVLYTYLAARFFPIVLATIASYALLVDRRRFRNRLPDMVLAVIAMFVVLAPLGWHFIHHPHDFWERADQVLIFRQVPGVGDGLRLLAGNGLRTAMAFFVRGDPRWHYNLPGRPIFDPLIAVFFLTGIAIALRRWRRMPYGIVLIWTAVMSLPGILTADLQPASQRMFGVFPALVMLPALGLDAVWCWIEAHRPRWRSAVLAGVIILFAGEGLNTIQAYFGQWAQRYETYEIFNGDYAQMAGIARAEIGAGHTVVFVSEHYKHPTLAYLAPETVDAVWTLGERGLVFPQRDTEETVYLVPREPFPPGGRVDQVLSSQTDAVEIVNDFAGRPAFTVYRVRQRTGIDPAAGPDFNGEVRFVDADWPPSVDRDVAVPITVRWQALRQVTGARTFALHLIDDQGVRWAQTDEMSYLSEQWRPGDRVIQWFTLPLDPTTPAGEYRLQLVLADAGSNPLPVLDTAGKPQGVALELGALRLTPEGGRVAPAAGGIDAAPGLRLLERAQVRGSLSPGARLELTVLWQRSGAIDGQPTLRIELVRDGMIWAAFERPLAGSYPPSRWRNSELVRGRYVVTIPADAPDGPTTVRLRIPGSQIAVDLGTLRIEAMARRFQVPAIGTPLRASLGEGIRFLGYDLPQRTFRPGNVVPLTLYWQAAGHIEGDYKVFTHLLDPGGQVRGQKDNFPVEDTRPTPGWLPGEVIADPYRIPLAPDAPPGTYQLEIGMYDPDTLARLPARDADGNRLPDDRVLLTEIEVVER